MYHAYQSFQALLESRVHQGCQLERAPPVPLVFQAYRRAQLFLASHDFLGECLH